MTSRTRAVLSVVTLGLVVSVIATGCGSSIPLTYNKSADKPVIMFTSTQALSPVYNPTSPEILIYGDGTAYKKTGPYSYTKGTLQSTVPQLLQTIESFGFFNMSSGSSSGTAGGVMQTITVWLVDNGQTRKYTVSAPQGGGPSGWDSVVNAVTGAKVTGSQDYTPTSVTLSARDADPSATAGATVQDWPAGAGDLAKAAAADKRLVISGDQAATAWKTIGPTYEGAPTEVVWRYNGKLYSLVYASPIFGGVTY
jgi:hypothetical protein